MLEYFIRGAPYHFYSDFSSTWICTEFVVYFSAITETQSALGYVPVLNIHHSTFIMISELVDACIGDRRRGAGEA